MTTKHTHPTIFGRREPGCPRCAELAAGAKPVQWSRAKRAAREAQFRAELAAHDCKRAGCMAICTFGDW